MNFLVSRSTLETIITIHALCSINDIEVIVSGMKTFRFRFLNQYLASVRLFTHHLLKTANTIEDRLVDIIASNDYSNKAEVAFVMSADEKYTIKYNCRGTSYSITVFVIESDDFKGTGMTLAKWIEGRLHIQAEDYSTAELVVSEFITEAYNFNKKKERTKISVQTFDRIGGWRNISELPGRPMDSIYIDAKEKQRLLSDLDNFIKDEDDYIRLGIPYKRCYLFQGNPGSGKSSLIFAIATLLKRDINIFNFSTEVSDPVFISAVSQLSADRLLVFEDIDSLFNRRSPTDTNQVSFSTVLNVLDGVCRKDKMLVFITTNHIRDLDPALLRPGRVDYILKFGFAAKAQIKEMYDKFRGDAGSKEEFRWMMGMIERKRINMSLMQKFLFDHRRDEKLEGFEKELGELVNEHAEKEVMGVI